MAKKRPLTNKQEAFCEEYCNNGYNATQAYKKAYPDCKGGWHKLGSRLMAKDGIRTRIARYRAGVTAKVDHDRDKAIELLKENIATLDQIIEGAGTGLSVVQAINARTAVVRELNAISNLHGQTITNKTTSTPLPAADQEAYSEAGRNLTLKLAKQG